MIKAIMTGAMALALLAGTAMADTIGTGRDGGGYDARATSFVQQLGGDWDLENYAGSEDIARAVCDDDNDVNIGIMQIDAMVQLGNEGCVLAPVGVYPAQEYAFIMFPPGGENELDDFNGTNRVLVGEAGSGTALFWRTIVAIENGENGNGSAWSEMTPVFGPTALANAQASMGQINAVIMVTSPDAQAIQDLLNLGWTVGELDDKDIDDFQFNGSSLYTRSTIEIDDPNAWRNIKQDAVEVRSFWAANMNWVTENQGELNRIASVIGGIR